MIRTTPANPCCRNCRTFMNRNQAELRNKLLCLINRENISLIERDEISFRLKFHEPFASLSNLNFELSKLSRITWIELLWKKTLFHRVVKYGETKTIPFQHPQHRPDTHDRIILKRNIEFPSIEKFESALDKQMETFSILGNTF